MPTPWRSATRERQAKRGQVVRLLREAQYRHPSVSPGEAEAEEEGGHIKPASLAGVPASERCVLETRYHTLIKACAHLTPELTRKRVRIEASEACNPQITCQVQRSLGGREAELDRHGAGRGGDFEPIESGDAERRRVKGIRCIGAGNTD